MSLFSCLPLDIFELIAFELDVTSVMHLLSVLETSAQLDVLNAYTDPSNVSFWRSYFARQYPKTYSHLRYLAASSTAEDFSHWKSAVLRRHELDSVWPDVTFKLEQSMMLTNQIDYDELIHQFKKAGEGGSGHVGSGIMPTEFDNVLKEHSLLNLLEKSKDLSVNFYCGSMLGCWNVFQNTLPTLTTLLWEQESDESVDLLDVMVDFVILFKPVQDRHALRQRVRREMDKYRAMVKDELIDFNTSNWDEMKGESELKEAQKVLHAINSVLFDKVGLRGVSSETYYRCENSFIDDVLISNKQGIPITLCLIYMHLARELKVNLRPTNAPCHLVLRWDHKELEQPLFIDCFNRGQQVSMAELNIPEQLRNAQNCSPVHLRAVVKRMARNILRCLDEHRQHGNISLQGMRMELKCYELQVSVDPLDLDCLSLLFYQYTRLDIINSKRLLEVLNRTEIAVTQRGLPERQMRKWQNIHPVFLQAAKVASLSNTIRKLDMDDSRVYEKRTRSRLVHVHGDSKGKFAVGLIFRHRKYLYKAVITQWDPVCSASEEWIAGMGVDNLRDGRHQPFYNVLVCDGSERYVAEENIEPLVNAFHMVQHEKVGKFFSAHADTHYVANQFLKQLYPEDESVLLSLLNTNN